MKRTAVFQTAAAPQAEQGQVGLRLVSEAQAPQLHPFDTPRASKFVNDRREHCGQDDRAPRHGIAARNRGCVLVATRREFHLRLMDHQPSIPIERASKRARWKLRVAFTLLALTVIIGILLNFWPGNEPTHNGRPISDYFTGLNFPENSTNYIISTEAIRAVGTNAVPSILKSLQSQEPRWVQLYLTNRARLPVKVQQFVFRKLDPFSYRNARYGAVHAVGVVGTNAAPWAEEFVTLLPRIPAVRRGIYMESLVKIGSAIVDPIEEMLLHSDPQVRHFAAFICYRLGPRASRVAPTLVAGLEGANSNYRRMVAQTLNRMGAGTSPSVIDLLRSDEPSHVLVGLEATGYSFSLASSNHLHAVLEAVDHLDKEVRIQAALLNCERWPIDPAEARETLQERNDSSEMLTNYLSALVAFEKMLPKLLKALSEGLDHTDTSVQIKCINSLIERGVGNEDVEAALIKLENTQLEQHIDQRVERLRSKFNALREEQDQKN